jgi:myo-inositol-1(or 4)-monophosphatase
MVERAEPADLLAVARFAASAGAQVALEWRDAAGGLRVQEKAGPADLVSQADEDTERVVRAVLAQRRPHDGILGEEQGSVAGSTGVRWLVDPIDGTTSYLYGRADWSVSVAAYAEADGRLLAGVVVEPLLGRCTEASAGRGAWSAGEQLRIRTPDDLSRMLVEINLGRPDQRDRAGAMVGALTPHVRDLRRSGSAAAALAMVATGRADAAWIPGVQPWDCAAGVLLAEEAGALVGDLSGPTPGTWPPSGDVLAAPPAMWESLREMIVGVYQPVT